MPKASEHQSSAITKLLYLGDSATGKTTSLCSLLKEGYKLRIYDYDILLDSLISAAKRECPEKLDNLEFMSFRDNMKATANGPVIDGQPKAFVDGLRALTTWEDGSKPSDWGANTVLVIDSLTTLSRAAFWWAKGLQGAANFAEGVSLKGYDPRNSFFTAQSAVLNVISMLTAPSLKCNVIVIAHVKYLEQDGITKGFPMSIGSALSPEIPTYFPSVALASKGPGADPKHVIRVRSTNMLDLKNPRFFDVPELPMETGLVTIFKQS